jgi:hypothetical protein
MLVGVDSPRRVHRLAFQPITMFVPDGGHDFGWYLTNHTTRPTGFMGTVITPGNNSKGSYAQCFSAIAQDVYLIHININNAATSGSARDIIMDVGIDEAGGTSYTVKIPDLIGSCAGTNNGSGGINYIFPLFIKSGSTIACRASQNGLTTGFRTWIKLYGQPRNPAAFRVGSRVEAIGVTAASSCGTSITPGTTNEGSWTSIGSLTNDAWWFQHGFGVNDSTMTSQCYLNDVAVGSSGELPLITDQLWISNSVETHSSALYIPAEREVPSGAAIYARSWCEGTPDSSMSAIVYALGG